MILSVYSVYDVSIKAYMQPFFAQSNAAAQRSFMVAVNDPQNTMLHRHPEDFILYHIGWFDDEAGTMEKLTPGPAKLVSALSVKQASGTMADEVRQPVKG